MHAALATRFKRPLVLLGSAVLLLVSASAFAMPPGGPPWDHYKVYDVPGGEPPPFTFPIILRDQFHNLQTPVFALERFANPTQKILSDGTGDPIFDPSLHYAWWRIDGPSIDRRVDVENQFGAQTLDLFRPIYLLNPALKNEPGEPPLRNHYECYDCAGPTAGIPVTMVDQFGAHDAVVANARFFCTPAEKEVPGAAPYLIVEPAQHYVCYTFTPPDPRTFTVLITDQFVINTGIAMDNAHILCVPTMKVDPTPTVPHTWGRLKSLYR